MWYRVIYNMEETGILPHVVHESLLDLHNRYIRERYNAEPSEVEELDDVWLDPGGMVCTLTEPYNITLDDETNIKVKEEHICMVADYFFNKDMYKLMGEAYLENKRLKNIQARFLSDDAVKVYMAYYILVMDHETYLKISSVLEGKYIKGLETYFKLVEKLSGHQPVYDLNYYFPHIEPAEA